MEKKNRILNFLIFLIIVVIAVAVILIVMFSLRYKREEKVYDMARETAEYVDAESGERSFDFEFLESYSGNRVCSWITIPGTKIDYPLVHAEDNDYYLDHDAFGNKSSSGAIFLNSYNNVSLDDDKSIVFGHSMKNGSMFHDLHKYADQAFGKDHRTLTIYMINGDKIHYHLLCEMKTKAGNEAVYGVFDSVDRKECASYLAASSDRVYADPVDTDILILSTCVKGDIRRVVVFQKDEI